MRVVLIGATGMVGQGVLRACLRAADVQEVILLGRRMPTGYDDPRITAVLLPDLASFQADAATFADVDACFFCAGVSSLGMQEAAYRQVTYDLTLHIAQQLLARSTHLSMVYVSGAGADSTEQSPTMWARVRGQTENALQRLPLAALAIFRPAVIAPERGIQSRTAAYRWMYTLLRPVLGLAHRLWPASVLTTAVIGDAMLQFTRHGKRQRVVMAPADIHRLAAGSPAAAEHGPASGK